MRNKLQTGLSALPTPSCFHGSYYDSHTLFYARLNHISDVIAFLSFGCAILSKIRCITEVKYWKHEFVMHQPGYVIHITAFYGTMKYVTDIVSQVIIAVLLTIQVFWNMTLCFRAKGCRRFGRFWRLRLQGEAVQKLGLRRLTAVHYRQNTPVY